MSTLTLVWDNLDTNIEVHYPHLNVASPLIFNCNTWKISAKQREPVEVNDLDEPIVTDIFITMNNYFTTLDDSTRATLYHLYKEIYNLLDSEMHIVELNMVLNTLVNQLLECINWERFTQFCFHYGDQNLEIGRKDILNETDRHEITFYTKDYQDLVFFSILLKMIMPIWGMYCNIAKNVLGSERVFMHAVDLIRGNYVDNNPAFIKLDNFVSIYVDNNVKSAGFSIMGDLGVEELPDHMLSFILWKKVVIFDGRSKTRSIVQNIYNLLKDRCERISKEGPKQKGAEDTSSQKGSSEDPTIGETYKIIQRVAPGISVIVSHCIMRDDFINHIDPNISDKTLRYMNKRLNSEMIVREFHLPLLSLICGHAIGKRNVQLVSYIPLFTKLIPISAAAALTWGFPTIADILIDTPSERDTSLISGISKVQTPIHAGTQKELNEIYKFAGVINPGNKLIEATVREVVSLVWNFENGSLENLTNEIAQLIIYINNR